MSDFTKRVIAALCLSACFAGLGMESLSPSFGGEMVRPLRPRCEVKRICPVESVPAAVLSPLGSYGRKMAASVVAQDWFEKAKAKLLKRGEAHTNVVDVLVAFDTSAKAWLADNGYGSSDEFAAICIRRMNDVLANSGLLGEFSFRLAGTAKVDVDVPKAYHAVEGYYDSNGRYWDYEYTDLSRLLDDAVGDSAAGKRSSEWAALRAERELTCADVVSVLVASEDSGTVGLAYSLDRMSIETPEYFADHAYSAVCIRRVMKDCTQVHEIGHLMGAGHSDEMSVDYWGADLLGPQLFPYSASAYFDAAPAGAWAEWRYTVMGYNLPGWYDEYGEVFADEEPCFSSPLLFAENGAAMGDATHHDNARTLRETYAMVANYRVSKAQFRVVVPEGGGTATGQGTYMPGQTVKFVAKPSAGHVFAGWYSAYDEAAGEFLEPFDRGSADYRTASLQFAAGAEGETVYARFVTPAVDAAGLSVDAADVTTGADGTLSLRLGPLVSSLSTPKLSVKGLPAGLKYDAKTLQISGMAKKPGVYLVTVQATNASVKKATPASTATFSIIVPNFSSRVLPNLRPETDAYGTVWCGVEFAADRVDCTPLAGWTVKASGLPAGLKFDASKGVVGGVPTKAGSYTVTFVASKNGEQNQVATITLDVKALPSWAVGTFNGRVKSISGVVTVTVAANGKVVGSLLEGGKSWSLSAPAFSRAELPENMEPMANPDPRPTYYATVVAKSGKEVEAKEIAVTAEVMALDSSNQPCRGIITGTTLGSSTPIPQGMDQGPYITAWQNLWKNEPWKTKAKPFAKAPTLDVQVDGGTDGAVVPGVVTLKFASSGAVTAKGVFTTGYDEKKKKDITFSASCSSVLIPVASVEGQTSSASASSFFVCLYFPPKAGKFDGCAAIVGVEWTGSSFKLR